MKKRSFWLVAALIAVCFLYSGSVYMSQSYRLIALFGEKTADLVTSVAFYLLQAAGIGLCLIGFRKKPRLFGQRRLYAVSMVTGALCMALSLLTNSGLVLLVAGCLFHLHVGVWFFHYLTILSRLVPDGNQGLCFGSAYALASIGTYLLSLARAGSFLATHEIVAVYLVLCGLTTALVLSVGDPIPEPASPLLPNRQEYRRQQFHLLVPLVAIMTVLFATGSGLYYSLEVASGVNWALIRVFYALGLILAGVLMDRLRFAGEILTVASLVYPLVSFALIGDGMTSFAMLAVSYMLRGFITLFYIVSFTKPGHTQRELLPLASLGLLISRAAEALISALLLSVRIPDLTLLLLSAACFLPLLLLFVIMQNRRYAPAPLNEEQRLALFSKRYNLTARELEVLRSLSNGLTDSEIAGQCFISRNTVRFHVSNLLKKTGAASRVDLVRALRTFR